MAPSATRLARESHGFTIVELLVAILASTVIIGALYTILEVSLHQSSRLADFTQATQLGRTSMTRIIDELHSACLSQGFKPVQAKSSENTLILVNGYSKEAEIAPSHVRKDKIEWNKATGTLTDSTVTASNTSVWPNFTFPETYASTVRLSEKERISLAEVEKEYEKEGLKTKVKEKLPVFRYYKYATEPSTSGEPAPSAEAGGGVATLVQISLSEGKELTPEQAEKVASVQVSFRTAPASGSKEAARSADQSTQVTFSFAAPSSEATIKAAPCE